MSATFLPYIITGICLVIAVCYILYTRQLTSSIKATPFAWIAILFCLLTSCVGFLSGNTLGGFCGILLLVVFINVFYYRCHIKKDSFEMALNICCILSILSALYAFIEFGVISSRLQHNYLDFFVANAPKDRVHAGFYNANYYAMMIEFIVLICFYKILQTKSKKFIVLYSICIICNMFVLYLTGCRSALVPFIFSVPLLLLFHKRFKLFASAIGLVSAAGIMILSKPSLLQRVAYIGEDFLKRQRIWETAMKGIAAHPLLGEGPLTYFHIYKLYNGHPTQHAHSIYLDPFLSHGFIGVIMIGCYMGSQVKEILQLWKKKIDYSLFGLLCAIILTVLLHGLLDYTVFWIQSGTLFLLCFSSSSMYRECFKKKLDPL